MTSEAYLEFLAELGAWIAKINWSIDMGEAIGLWGEISANIKVESTVNWDQLYDNETFELKSSFQETKQNILRELKINDA